MDVGHEEELNRDNSKAKDNNEGCLMGDQYTWKEINELVG